MSTIERNLYHINVNHKVGFKGCLIGLNDFVFFCAPYLNNLLGIFRIKVSELVRVELVHDILAEHIGEFMFFHLTVQRNGTHQFDILFLHAVPVEQLQKRLNHNLPKIRFFGSRKRLAVIVEQDEHF